MLMMMLTLHVDRTVATLLLLTLLLLLLLLFAAGSCFPALTS
jgi:hypothetical protein